MVMWITENPENRIVDKKILKVNELNWAVRTNLTFQYWESLGAIDT